MIKESVMNYTVNAATTITWPPLLQHWKLQLHFRLRFRTIHVTKVLTFHFHSLFKDHISFVICWSAKTLGLSAILLTPPKL